MAKRLLDLARWLIPLGRSQKEILAGLAGYLDEYDTSEVRSLCRQRKAVMEKRQLEVSAQILEDRDYPFIKCRSALEDDIGNIEKLNRKIEQKKKEWAFRDFAGRAATAIPWLIAPNIVGLEEVKRAAALQLFSGFREPAHILLLGDPGTGKTDILRSSAALHSISGFGLGSGTTGVGLTVTVKGDEVKKGLLPMADRGICAIDELNLMQERDRASLYNAMEKGFVTYDKGGTHHRFDARVRIIATANPKGDRFAGWTLETLKKQLPFDSALLSRFHLVFLIRKPGLGEFVEISRRIVRNAKAGAARGDERFVQEYVNYAEAVDVAIPKEFEDEIVKFVAQIKKNERRYLIEVSPRVVLGFLRLAKASARMELRSTAEKKDILLVKNIVTEGLTIKKGGEAAEPDKG